MPKSNVLHVVVSWNGNSFDLVRHSLIRKIRKSPITSWFSFFDMSADIVFTISKRRANNFFYRVQQNMTEIANQYKIGSFSVAIHDSTNSNNKKNKP